MNLDNAVVYDIETIKNVFTFHMECLNSSVSSTWEISPYRNDLQQLIVWFRWMQQTQTPMIGFNNIHFDYPVIHYILNNPSATYQQIYNFAQTIINAQNQDRFKHVIWARDRFAPQIDLFKIHHFDNKAKSTSLKALQVNMRLPNVVDMPIEHFQELTEHEINTLLIPYNKSDVSSTKEFAKHSMSAMQFRLGLVDQFGVDVMNWNDSKIGSQTLEQRLGDDVCYRISNITGRKEKKQTPRSRVALADIIFPFIHFNNPEFARILEYMKAQTLTPADLDDNKDDYKVQPLHTKGVFAKLHAVVDDVVFKFGTGGIHGSIDRKRVYATANRIIRDIDVASLYPNIGIQNELFPEHLGIAFVREYAKLPIERKEWQAKKGKKCTEANTLKLASNGTYGNSNSIFSVFYDPQYTMTITINGQLMLAMLVEWLLTVPSIKIIQANTDGITYSIDPQYLPQVKEIEKRWESLTKLVLEDANYSKMFIRDVNNYIAQGVDGDVKLKGAYWTPDPLNYSQSISEAQPPAWHKDLSNVVSIRAAVAHMTHGVDIEQFIRMTTNPYDFMIRYKVRRNDELKFGNNPIQKTGRFFVANNGASLIKTSPPAKGAQIGAYKRAPKIDDRLWQQVNAELVSRGQPDAWDARIHTKSKSKYDYTRSDMQAGYKVMICNDVRDFDFNNVNYAFYVNEAMKLVI